MPELPEVETVCQGLKLNILGDNISNVTLLRDNLRTYFDKDFRAKLIDKKIIDIARRAKYIQIHLSDNLTLIIHLGMTGKLILHTEPRGQILKHDHVIFNLNSTKQLVYNDARRFGLMSICPSDLLGQHLLFKNLGAEPLEKIFTPKYLADQLKNKKSPIKLAIMDNNIVVGVGNIYACESLFRAGISPIKPSNEVTKEELKKLVPAIKYVLTRAIEAGGSSFSDYVNASGETGYFQHQFKTYNRENKPCLKCSSPIKRIKQGGRSSFYCQSCQPLND